MATSMVVVAALLTGSMAAAAQDATPSESATDAAGSGSGTLTWSVRPTPTDADPERPNFSFDVEGGGSIEDSIRVRNFGEQPLGLDVYASDALTTSSGALDLLPAGEEPRDVGAWIALEADSVEVPPGEAVDIPFTMAVPANAEPGDHTGGIVTSVQTASEDDEGQAVVLDRRLGNRVQVRVGGDLAPTLQVRDLTVVHEGTLNPFRAGRVTVSYTVENTGNVRLAADQRVVVPGRLGLPGRIRDVEAMPELLPDNTLSFEAEVPGVWPTFRTTANVELQPTPTREGDTFDVDPVVATATASSIPWGQLLLLAVLVLLVAGIVWSRRRRQRREAAIREEARAEAIRGASPEPVSDSTTTGPAST